MCRERRTIHDQKEDNLRFWRAVVFGLSLLHSMYNFAYRDQKSEDDILTFLEVDVNY